LTHLRSSSHAERFEVGDAPPVRSAAARLPTSAPGTSRRAELFGRSEQKGRHQAVRPTRSPSSPAHSTPRATLQRDRRALRLELQPAPSSPSCSPSSPRTSRRSPPPP